MNEPENYRLIIDCLVNLPLLYWASEETGALHHGATCQGCRDGSAWARGQAWGVYGLATAYRYTKRESYIELFKKVTEYFMDHLLEDLCPFWDLEFTDGDDQPRQRAGSRST